MGLSWHEAKALIEFYKKHGPLGKTATLGRQQIYASRNRLASLVKDLAGGPQFIAELPQGDANPFADKFFALLGATEVVSFDNSDYQDASVVQDMNRPIPESCRDSFDFVYDGGTLEHIFNFPQGIKNCMDMVRVGGTFATSTPANNFMGHGFYQFSPELFFRLFCPENGFQLNRILAFEYGLAGAWFEVEDPKNLRRRAELRATGARIHLWVEARKARAQPGELPLLPQQSDYSAQWESTLAEVSAGAPPRHSFRQRVRAYADRLFPGLADSIRRIREPWRFKSWQRKGLRSDREAFKPIP